MDAIGKLKDYIKNLLESKNKKKLLENAVIVIIIGVIAIIAGGSFFGGEKEAKKTPSADIRVVEAAGKSVEEQDKGELEDRIGSMLSQIDGAGKVSVLITYVSGKEIVPATDTKKTDNETDEKDNGGGTRSINQSDYESRIVYEEAQGGGKKPVVLKEMQPAVKGVVIVADGAGDPEVKESLSKAVNVLLDVPVHKIQVFERRK